MITKAQHTHGEIQGHCGGSPSFNPATAIYDSVTHTVSIKLLHEHNDFAGAIRTYFGIPQEDQYIYRAVMAVTLGQVQRFLDAQYGGGGSGEVVSATGAGKTGKGKAGQWENKGDSCKTKGGNGENGGGSVCKEEDNKDGNQRKIEQRMGYGWYDTEGNHYPLPAPADITAYTSIFSGTTSPVASLKSFISNARKASIRQKVAQHRTTHRFIHPSCPHLLIPKSKSVPANPYLDIWAWSCHILSWCGPLPLSPAKPATTTFSNNAGTSTTSKINTTPTSTTATTIPKKAATPGKRTTSKTNTTTTNATITPNPPLNLPPASVQPKIKIQSHPILPILMHHFGCAVPTHEALQILTTLSQSRAIADIGSGSGYWTFLLRRYGNTCIPIDSAQSVWRTMWVGDTVQADGARWLSQHKNGKNMDC